MAQQTPYGIADSPIGLAAYFRDHDARSYELHLDPVAVFPDELYPAPRSWTERAFPKLIHYNKVERAALRGLGAAEALHG